MLIDPPILLDRIIAMIAYGKLRINLAIYVAKICESHVLPASDLIPEKGFNYDESIGQYKVNLSYLSLVLRLADILDFDMRIRTPDSL